MILCFITAFNVVTACAWHARLKGYLSYIILLKIWNFSLYTQAYHGMLWLACAVRLHTPLYFSLAFRSCGLVESCWRLVQWAQIHWGHQHQSAYGHLNDKPTGRQTTGDNLTWRWATLFGQLDDNIGRVQSFTLPYSCGPVVSTSVAQLTKMCRPVGCRPVGLSSTRLLPRRFVAQMTHQSRSWHWLNTHAP